MSNILQSLCSVFAAPTPQPSATYRDLTQALDRGVYSNPRGWSTLAIGLAYVAMTQGFASDFDDFVVTHVELCIRKGRFPSLHHSDTISYMVLTICTRDDAESQAYMVIYRTESQPTECCPDFIEDHHDMFRLRDVVRVFPDQHAIELEPWPGFMAGMLQRHISSATFAFGGDATTAPTLRHIITAAFTTRKVLHHAADSHHFARAVLGLLKSLYKPRISTMVNSVIAPVAETLIRELESQHALWLGDEHASDSRQDCLKW